MAPEFRSVTFPADALIARMGAMEGNPIAAAEDVAMGDVYALRHGARGADLVARRDGGGVTVAPGSEVGRPATGCGPWHATS